ncbi:acetamidase, partial [Thioclava sp. BHET1]
MCINCNHTIHARQHHFGWDNSFAPVQHVAPGETVLFHCHDSSAGQIDLSATVETVTAMDFGKINPVSGPIYVEGAEPGDALKITIDSFAPQRAAGKGWGWTANIPGFGLLADQFTDPALTLWSYDPDTLSPALWGTEARVPLKPFAGTIGVAQA